MQSVNFFYRLGLCPTEIKSWPSGRPWYWISRELDDELGLNIRKTSNKIKERKEVQGWLVDDFNKPFRRNEAKLLEPEDIIKVGQKVHILLMPSSRPPEPVVLLTTPVSPVVHTEKVNNLSEAERVLLLQQGREQLRERNSSKQHRPFSRNHRYQPICPTKSRQ